MVVLGGVAVSYERGTPVHMLGGPESVLVRAPCPAPLERGFFIDDLLVRIHYIIVMVKWTGLAPWEF